MIVGDRFSGWTDIYPTPVGSPSSGASGLIKCLRQFFATYGVPVEISTDGGPEFTASATKSFLEAWGVNHRKSSAYFPRSNGRAEVSVKSMKRLLRCNVSPNGSINNDEFLQALLQLHNTPDQECGVSSAQILYGRSIGDGFAHIRRLRDAQHLPALEPWHQAWRSKGELLIKRHQKSSEDLNRSSKLLGPLRRGDKCYVQNQYGNRPLKWGRSGTVVDVLSNDKYAIRLDGSTKVTQRNRKFLRRFEAASRDVQRPARGQLLEEDQTTPQSHIAPSQTIIHSQPAAQVQLMEPPSTSVPPAVKCLLPHNNPGLREDPLPPTTRLRSGRLVEPVAELAGDAGYS